MEKTARESKLNGLVETAIFVDKLQRASNFYESVLGLSKVKESDRGCVFRTGNQRYLLLVLRDAVHTGNETSSGDMLPPVALPEHDGRGPGHIAFGVSEADLYFWRARLAEHDVDLLEEIKWEAGAHSLYFRDPDGHMIELATPGIWESA